MPTDVTNTVTCRCALPADQQQDREKVPLTRSQPVHGGALREHPPGVSHRGASGETLSPIRWLAAARARAWLCPLWKCCLRCGGRRWKLENLSCHFHFPLGPVRCHTMEYPMVNPTIWMFNNIIHSPLGPVRCHTMEYPMINPTIWMYEVYLPPIK